MLHAHHLSLHVGARTLLEDATFSLDSQSKKKIALVGLNGAGKSTLLKVIAGIEEPWGGTISLSQESVGYLKQDLGLPESMLVGEFLESKLEEEWMSYKIDVVLEELGLSQEYLIRKIESLSGGEKLRIALAACLLDDPAILLMDEPTNHLDSQGIAWLEEFVKNFSGSILLISHDRSFIDRAMNEIWEIDPAVHTLNRFKGNYHDFLGEKKRINDMDWKEYDKHQKEIDEATLWLKENEFHPKYRFSDRVMSKKKILEQLLKEQPEKPFMRPEITLRLESTSNKKMRLLRLKIDEKRIPARVLFKDLDIALYTGEKVRITGPNGAGKSTLLKIIAGEDREYKGEREPSEHLRLAFLKQETIFPANAQVLDHFEKSTGVHGSGARSILAHFYFKDEKVNQRIGSMSLGEQKRLELAILVQDKPNLLILDEPTNHLDLYARESLEECLLELDIAMILVSHDQYFVEKLGIEREINLSPLGNE